MMVVEIIAGVLTGSMALLADTIHTTRISFRRRQGQRPGRVHLCGPAGFVRLPDGLGECCRLLHPVPIIVDQAILVAVLRLIVNGASVLILRVNDHQDDHSGDDSHHTHYHDHNLKATYLHVLTDALTSFLAIVALLSAKYFELTWMDPAGVERCGPWRAGG